MARLGASSRRRTPSRTAHPVGGGTADPGPGQTSAGPIKTLATPTCSHGFKLFQTGSTLTSPSPSDLHSESALQSRLGSAALSLTSFELPVSEPPSESRRQPARTAFKFKFGTGPS